MLSPCTQAFVHDEDTLQLSYVQMAGLILMFMGYHLFKYSIP